MSCIGMNDLNGKPPRYELPSSEKIARFFAHVELSICPMHFGLLCCQTKAVWAVSLLAKNTLQCFGNLRCRRFFPALDLRELSFVPLT